ncbi:hypothetical protein LguiA_001557 [Lonicera macranthoides]
MKPMVARKAHRGNVLQVTTVKEELVDVTLIEKLSDTFVTHLRYGAEFKHWPFLHYCGGEVNYYYDVHPDKMSYFKIKGIIEDHGHTNLTKDEVLEWIRSMLIILVRQMNIYVSDKSSDSSDGVEECDLEEESENESDGPSLDHVSDDDELIEIIKNWLGSGRSVELWLGNGSNSTRQQINKAASNDSSQSGSNCGWAENTKNVRGRRKKEEKRRSGTGEDGAAVRRWESGR